jgi:hypothetical protein
MASRQVSQPCVPLAERVAANDVSDAYGRSVASGRGVVRFAYADPPYVGQARKHYGVLAKEVNHRVLIGTLADYYEGWALSLSSPSLEEILGLCRDVLGPNQVRVGSWGKSFCSFKPGVNPAYTWEPVIFWGGRKRGREKDTLRDYLICPITTKRGTSGAKPDAFNRWVFEFLGAEPDDEFTDLFPGSGAVQRSWDAFRAEGRLSLSGRAG